MQEAETEARAGGGFSCAVPCLAVLLAGGERASDDEYSSCERQMGIRGRGKRTGLSLVLALPVS